MAQIPTLSDLTNLDEADDFMRFASATIGAIVDIVNGNLEFEKNIKAQIFSTTTPSVVGQEFSFTHDLNKSDVSFLVIYKETYLDVINGSSTNTSSMAYFRCNVASAKIRILVF